MTETNLLDRLYVASPCSVKWEEMHGDDRIRTCDACAKNVYNISNMAKVEAEELLRSKQTSMCVQFYRRHDGTIITDDCPVGLKKIRDTFRLAMGAVAAVASLIVSVTAAVATPHTNASNKKTKSTSAQINASNVDKKMNYFLRFPSMGGEAGFANFSSYGLPPFKKLISGNHPLSPEEIYEEDEQIFLRIPDCAISGKLLRLFGTTGVDHLDKNMTAQDCFGRAQACEQSKNFKTAEIYYRLTLKYFEVYPAYSEALEKDVLTKYAMLLRRRGEIPQAEDLEYERMALSIHLP